jgi:hypothetical protein
MKAELQQELYQRYKKLFEKSKRKECIRNPFYLYGIECGDGWFNLLDKLMDNITKNCDKIKVKYPVIFQIKEKFGGLRFYCSFEDEESYNIISKYIKEAELESEKTCEICGKKGKIENIRGWLQCLCKKHKEALKNNDTFGKDKDEI